MKERGKAVIVAGDWRFGERVLKGMRQEGLEVLFEIIEISATR
jgi:hypothetical protein